MSAPEQLAHEIEQYLKEKGLYGQPYAKGFKKDPELMSLYNQVAVHKGLRQRHKTTSCNRCWLHMYSHVYDFMKDNKKEAHNG